MLAVTVSLFYYFIVLVVNNTLHFYCFHFFLLYLSFWIFTALVTEFVLRKLDWIGF